MDKIFIKVLKYVASMLPAFIISTAIFYGVSMFVKDLGLQRLLLLSVIPALFFLIALINGAINGINIIYVTLSTVILIPAVTYYHEPDIIMYVWIYAGIMLVGNILGRILYKRKKQTNIEDEKFENKSKKISKHIDAIEEDFDYEEELKEEDLPKAFQKK